MTSRSKDKDNGSSADPQDSFKSLKPLLTEYTAKLVQLAERARTIKSKLKTDAKNSEADWHQERQIMRQSFNRLKGPLERLDRTASAFIEHGQLDEFAQLELRLRLAELENALFSAENLVV